MDLLGCPPERDFENMVRLNTIVNYPVTFDDVKNAKLVFGHDMTSLKGKSVRHKPYSIVTDYVEIHREILESRKELDVSTHIMFIKKLPFLVRISRRLKFTTIEYLASKNEIALVTYVNKNYLMQITWFTCRYNGCRPHVPFPCGKGSQRHPEYNWIA